MWVSVVLVVAAVAEGLNFLSVGDWGDTEAKTYVSDMMGQYAATLNASLVLAIGDNMYDTGVSSVDDPQFESKFEGTFTADSLQVPWYVVGGNHDYYGSIEAQVEYTNKSSRWNFPELYYSRRVEEEGVSLTVVGVDTWRLNGGDTLVAYDPRTNQGYIRDREMLDRYVADGTITPGTHASITRNFPDGKKGKLENNNDLKVKVGGDDEQLAQIEAWLESANSTWTVVLGHFPCYSATTGEHGETPSLIESLVPLLAKYQVDAYFSGHDHVLQLIQHDGVSYLGSGAGARSHTGMNTTYPGLVAYAQGNYGFMTHELTPTTFTTTFVVNDDGSASEPFTFTLTKDHS